jgi:hypothetical protein
MKSNNLKAYHAPNIIKVPKSQKILIKYISISEIKDILRRNQDVEIVKILIFIKALYDFKTISEASEIVGHRYETGLKWLEK